MALRLPSPMLARAGAVPTGDYVFEVDGTASAPSSIGTATSGALHVGQLLGQGAVGGDVSRRKAKADRRQIRRGEFLRLLLVLLALLTIIAFGVGLQSTGRSSWGRVCECLAGAKGDFTRPQARPR